MVGVDYEYRILCDPSFMRYIKNHSRCKSIIKELTYIKASSSTNKKEHTVMLEDDYDEIDSEKLYFDKTREISTLGACVRRKENPPFLTKETDNISKRIRYSVFLSNDKPYRTAILTVNEEVEKYRKNKHFINLKSAVSIKSGEEALRLLTDYFDKFIAKKAEYC